MKRLFCLTCLISLVYTSNAQLNDFTQPFLNKNNAEPSRSEFITYRRTSGTKGSPIDPALSFSPIEKWTFSKANNSNIASADLIVPFEFVDKALYLNVGPTAGEATIYINDKEVGRKSDSKLNTEFNITKFVERGLNRLKIVVKENPYAQKIEQNQTKNSDIVNNVYLFAQPKIRIFDITTRTSLDPSYKNGLLEIALLLKTELLNTHEVTVFYDLFDKNGKLVKQESKNVKIDMKVQDTVRFTATIFDVEKWSHENPNLYTVEFKIKRDGRFTENMWRKVNFKTVETKDKKLLINGVETKIFGINADILPTLIDNNVQDSELLDELQTIKFAGINGIRTPYPLKKSFYEICDSLGLYVFETANINSKNSSKSIMKGGTLANDPAWKDIFVDRAVSAFERSKNLPSVIAIGLGSDAGNGYNMYQAYNEIRKRDQTKLIVYNDANSEWNTDISMNKYEPTALQPTIIAKAENFADINNISGAFLSGNISGVEQIGKLIDTKGVVIEEVNKQKGLYKIINNLKTVNLNQLQCTFKVFNNDGKAVKSSSFVVDVAPNSEIDIELPNSANRSVEITIGKIAKFKN